MRKRLRVCLSFVAAMLLCIAMSLCIAACAEDPKNPPVKVSDGTSAELSVGETETFAVADYITANGSPVTAESSDDAVATAAVIEKVYMQIVSSDGSKTVTLPNFDWSDAADSVTVRGCTLVSYKANLIEYGFAPGKKVYIRITDNGTRDYGLFFLDSVITYYPDGNEPDDTFRLVSKYRILNGGFETGNLTGWTLSRAEGSEGDIGTVTSQDTYWQNTVLPTTPYGKDGTNGYKVYIGGRWGKKIAMGRTLNKIFTSKEEIIKLVEKAILFYREQGKTGERFAETVERLGFENVEAQLLSDDILERKQEILEAKLHETGGATC